MEALSSSLSIAPAGRKLAASTPAMSALQRRGPLQRQRLPVPVRCALSSQAGRAVQATLLRHNGKRKRTSVIALISEAVSVNVSVYIRAAITRPTMHGHPETHCHDHLSLSLSKLTDFPGKSTGHVMKGSPCGDVLLSPLCRQQCNDLRHWQGDQPW